MIAETLQDQAALYALDALDAAEVQAFERELERDAELRAFVRQMREAAADLAHVAPAQSPPAQLKQRILRELALEKQGSSARSTSAFGDWIPWAIAALFLIFCGVLLRERSQLQRQLNEAREDSLAPATFVRLGPPKGEHSDATVTVAWQPNRQSGVITILNMPPAAAGHDYQLWAIDSAHKDPVNAGIIHVDSNGVARVRFKPNESLAEIKAFAISLEREGGVPKREGPIIMIGNA